MRKRIFELTFVSPLICKYVTRHEKTELMCTKYTYSYYGMYFLHFLEICKPHEIPYEKPHK